jgi:hypothetical protein
MTAPEIPITPWSALPLAPLPPSSSSAEVPRGAPSGVSRVGKPSGLFNGRK